jgi:hypothetical protein
MQIALLIFCLLTMAGSFRAWRKSPLYSIKTTLKLVGGILLIVAVIAGSIIAITDSSLSRSPVAEVIASLVAVIAVGCGASVFIVRITDSHVAALPPTARLVSFNRHKIYRWIWLLVAFLLINAVAALVLPTSWQWLPVGLGGFVLVACGPTLSIAYMMARRNDRGMSAVIANPWVHWQYAQEKWAQWADNLQRNIHALSGKLLKAPDAQAHCQTRSPKLNPPRWPVTRSTTSPIKYRASAPPRHALRHSMKSALKARSCSLRPPSLRPFHIPRCRSA